MANSTMNLFTIPPKNESGNDFINQSFDFENNPGLVSVLIACCFTAAWLFFITFYNSRILAFIVTKLLSKFYLKDGSIYIGSFSVSLLSGKIMFRDVRYVTKDFCVQCVDGLAIFKWWLSYDIDELKNYKNISKDDDLCEVSRCRLTLQLNGFEFHLYNRSDLYNNIQDILKSERYGDARKSVQSLDILKTEEKEKKNVDDSNFGLWRDLFPLIQINIRSGKLAIGNRLLETTLWVHFNTGTAAYSMPDASSTLDHFTHLFQCKCDDVRILLSRSPGYKGTCSEPPRFMGQGFVILQSGQAKICYSQDEPGLMPVESGDTSPEPDPEWACDIKFSKSATVTYGPWVDKQRDAIQKFFLPNDFQELPVTKPLEPEQRRIHSGLDVNIEFVGATTIDLLFSKNEVTSAIHICCNKSSSVHFYQPWTVNDYGYTSNIVAHLHQIEVSTSMQFRKLMECDMVEIAVNMMVPRMWNSFQHWTCELWLSKITLYFIYEHVHFFTDLLNDWAITTPPDIATFVPFEWEFNFYLRDFELILLVNQHNWIDCTNEDENSEIALCGETLDINFVLPFIHYLPTTVETKLFFRGETVMLRNFVPESNTLRRSIVSLAKSSDRVMYPKNARTTSMAPEFDQVDGPDDLDEVDSRVNPEDQLSKGWRRRTKGSSWIDIWSVPVIILNLFYKYHPISVENEHVKRINKLCGLDYSDLEQSQLAADIITVELEAGSSAIRLFGHFWRQFFIGFKNNYFGVNQMMQEFNAMRERSTNLNMTRSTSVIMNDDIRYFRPFEANVTVVLLDIQAELTMHTMNDSSSPQAYADRITFEMHKTFQETRLQLITSPISIIVQNAVKDTSGHLNNGFLTLSGLQFRGHAMFSDKDIPLGDDTMEYAWLMEIQCGKLTGKISPLQAYTLLNWMQTFLLHGTDEENNLIKPNSEIKCQHNLPQSQCNVIDRSRIDVCPTEDVVKYKMVRFSLESVNIFITEVECACNLQASPIRFSTCNSSNGEVFEGGSFFFNDLVIRQYIQQVNFSLTDSVDPQYVPSHSNSWVEVGVVGLGPLTADINELCDSKQHQIDQSNFLTLHDQRTKRLWFLWGAEDLHGKLSKDRQKSKICGCVGGCNFFGSNNNGVRFFTNQTLDGTNKKHTHYGSESLWGGETVVGSNIKEHLLRQSSHLSAQDSIMGSTKLSSKQMLNGGSFISRGLSSTGTDIVDHVSGMSSSFLGQLKRGSSLGRKDTDSKLAFGRSQSLVNKDISRYSLSRADSDEGTFYSCNSSADLQDENVKLKQRKPGSSPHSKKSAGSSGSYLSAISSSEDLLDKTDASSWSFQPLVAPGLLSAYSNYMQPVTCINWRQNVPSGLRKKFSLLKNLKVICPPGHRCALPSLPNFNPCELGKLPFVLVNEGLEKDDPSDDTRKEKKENRNVKNNVPKTYVSIKLHQKMSLALTPLVIQSLDRYITSLKAIPNGNHLSHVLNALHFQCTIKTKYRFLEKKVIKEISTNYLPVNELRQSLHKMASPNNLTVAVTVPEINVVFFQIASERYTPSEQSSLSGQCGSEFSCDMDIRNTDSILLAISISNLNLNINQDTENDAIFNSTAMLVHKLSTNDSCKESVQKLASLCRPSVNTFFGNISSIQLQVLHLEGAADKQLHVTCIPRESSKVNFTVKPGGSLYLDNISLVDNNKQEMVGNIIFEAEIRSIKMKGFERKTLIDELVYEKENVEDEIDDIPSKHHTVLTMEAELDVEHDNEDGVQFSKAAQYSAISNSSSSFESTNSYNHYRKGKKGYIKLDMDSGDDADMSNDESEHHVSFISGSERTGSGGGPSVRYKKKSRKVFKEKEIVDDYTSIISLEMSGNVEVKNIWVNLAAPTRLRNMNGENDQDVNLVTVLVPALTCWMLPVIDMQGSIKVIMDSFKTWQYSVVACLLGQALPEHGRLLKKYACPPAINELSKFLQEDYSSQLISVIRRQTVGHRLLNLEEALKCKTFFPRLADLESGIIALARQWKCVFIGAEGNETIFTIPYGRNKKPVVGRGNLTRKDREFLLKDRELKDSYQGSHSLSSPVSNLSKSQILSPHRMEHDHEANEKDTLLSSSSESEDDERKIKRPIYEKEQSLYDWMSKSPVSSPMHSPSSETRVTVDDENETGHVEPDSTRTQENVQNEECFEVDSPMVSVPTSGMQLANATEVFASMLDVIHIKRQKFHHATEAIKKGSFALGNVEINLITSDDGKVGKKTEVPPAFEMKKLQLLLQSKQKPLLPFIEASFFPTDILCIVDVTEVHQHLNFALVRLFLQITETLNVVKEEKKFAKKSSESNCRGNTYDWNNAGASDPALEMPKSWRNMFNVMKLYTTLPDEQSVSPNILSPATSRTNRDIVKAGTAYFLIREDFFPVLKKAVSDPSKTDSKDSTIPISSLSKLSITGTALLRKAKFTASISGLELDFEMRRINATYYKNRKSTPIGKNAPTGFSDTSSSSVHMEKLKICLVESVKAFKDDNIDHIPPRPALKISRTLMTCKVYRSHALHTSNQQTLKKSTQRSLCFIGPIAADVPQNPGALRVIVTRFTNRLQKHFFEFDEYRSSKRDGHDNVNQDIELEDGSLKESLVSTTVSATFRISISSILCSAALLPSLRAEYKIDLITGWGSLKGKAKFFFELPSHTLSFNTKFHVVPLPATTHIDLPHINVDGHYLEISNGNSIHMTDSSNRSHGFLRVSVNIGSLEQNLTTDLLNHLIFLQKGFAKEVSDVMKDVETNEPVSLWASKSVESLQPSLPMIYSIQVKIEAIQITATTPSSIGVRLETGEVSLVLSNKNPASSVLKSPGYNPTKAYGKAQVDLHVSLGQFSKVNYMRKDFDVFSHFSTTLVVNNTLSDKPKRSNRETILVALNKPHFYLMPAAVDKGVLVYLHYKNAYNYWMEQRTVLTAQFPAVAERILNRLPQQPITEQLSSYLFLQVNITNLGVCLPLKEKVLPSVNSMVALSALPDYGPGSALLITVEESSITGCSSGSFVSTGLFRKFCLRFIDNFEHTSNDWSVNKNDIMNTYAIPEGTYDLCSRTVSSDLQADVVQPGKWVMTLFWKMRGINIHIDSNIGKKLNLLTHTLTAITGDSDVADLSSVADAEDIEQEADFYLPRQSGHDNDYDVIDGAMETVLQEENESLEKQLWLQTKRVNEYRRNKAHPELISREVKQLQEIETALSNEFFKDVKRRFRRSKKRSTIAGRKKSFVNKNKSPSYLDPSSKSKVRLRSRSVDWSFQPVELENSSEYSKDQIDAPTRETVFFDTVSEESIVQKTQTKQNSNPDEFVDIKTTTSDETNRVKFSSSTIDVRSDITETAKSVTETALDFELNVVVDIDSGKCTFHTENNEPKEGDTINGDEYSRKLSEADMSSKGYHRPLRPMRSTGQAATNQSTLPEKTVILIPGVNVRIHYLSTNIVENLRNGSTDSEATDRVSQYGGSTTGKQQFIKAAGLNAFVSIQSLPKEMIVRPSLFDFIDKALEPIITTEAEDVNTTMESESLGGTGSLLSSSGAGLYSFPVDVVVLIRVEPSDLRFSCLPVSRVEFLLRVPSLDFAITSSPSSVAANVSSPKKKGGNSKRSNGSHSSVSDPAELSSSFSFTLCLSRFSFCIFHPYGKQFGNTSDRTTSSTSGSKRKEFKPLGQPISGRKDSLSLNVEFIKFNLLRNTIRTPKEGSNNSCDFHTSVKISALCDIGSASFNYDMRRLNEILDVPKAWYKRGLVQRMFLGKEGTYATHQSVHQVSKIKLSTSPQATADRVKPTPLVLPKETTGMTAPPKSAFLSVKKTPVTHRRSVSTGASFLGNLMGTPFTTTPRSANLSASRNDSFFKYDTAKQMFDLNREKDIPSHSDDDMIDGPSSYCPCNEWQTKIAIGFNISRIDVSTNMGNVMGQVIWSTNDLRADSDVLLNNTGVRRGHVDVSVRQGTLDAHGGVIGGYLEVQEITAVGKFDENLGELPLHSAIIGMKSGEVRLDYMGSSVVMAALSLFSLKLEDRWLLPDMDSGNTPISSLSELSEKPTEIHLVCDSHWDEFQAIISKSTTSDILKIKLKLEDFINQQRQSSAMALSSLRDGYQRPRYSSVTVQMEDVTDSAAKADTTTNLKYQHWVELLNGLYGISLNNITTKIPDKNIVLGGTLGLHGNFVSLACFNGSNFRSQNWGLFTIREPCLQFVSETKVVEKSCQVMRADCVHDVVFSLGSSNSTRLSERRRSAINMHDFMATVRRVSRGRRNPPSLGAPVQEWLAFVNNTSDDDIPSTKPTSKPEVGEKFSHTKAAGGLRKVSFAPKYRYENESEVIFALPRLSLQLKTEHDQPVTEVVAKILREGEDSFHSGLFPTVPSTHVVDSSFISHFDDSLHVTMDVSLLFYLHNLILSYMKEKKETGLSVSSRHPRSQAEEHEIMENINKAQAESAIKKEEKYREFRCKSWRLEPRIRLLSWAGKRMDPVSIDWVLEKLGFMDAALTIPKWVQRGALDPMDMALAVLMGHLLAHMKEKEEGEI